MILSMAAEMGLSNRVSSCVEDFSRFGFGDSPCFHSVIAERDGDILGMCLYLFTWSSWRGTRGVYVQDIYLRGSERSVGLGQQLLAEVARRAGVEGAKFLRLSVARENLKARSFYQKLGLKLHEEECICMATGAEFEALKTAG
jgi:GNAT superfamily N-acetyltransferase